MIRPARIVEGWLLALAASALPALWATRRKIAENPLGRFVDENGDWTAEVYWQFLQWWLPIAAAVSLLALACMFLDRSAD
jgi:hypothetical protein